MQSPALFPLFYLPPVSYFSALNQQDFNVELERFEHFPKQTYRNRATIVSPNGALNLFLPVVKGSKFHTTVKDVRISYDFKWQRLHWLSLQTCYRNSAYFEYYEDDFARFFEKQPEFLFDHNLEILDWLLKQLKKKVEFKFTTEFLKAPEGTADFRDRSLFKSDADFPAKPYFQVFDDRNGFLPNMSIVDLLFNQGPQAKAYL